MKYKIIGLEGHPLSGLRILWVESEKGIEPIFGDWRLLTNLVEDVGIGNYIE